MKSEPGWEELDSLVGKGEFSKRSNYADVVGDCGTVRIGFFVKGQLVGVTAGCACCKLTFQPGNSFPDVVPLQEGRMYL